MNTELYNRINTELANFVSQINLDPKHSKESLEKVKEVIVGIVNYTGSHCKQKTHAELVTFLYAFNTQMTRLYNEFYNKEIYFAVNDKENYPKYEYYKNYVYKSIMDAQKTFNQIFEINGNMEKIISSSDFISGLNDAINRMGTESVIRKFDESIRKMKDSSKKQEENKQVNNGLLHADPLASKMNDKIIAEEKKTKELQKKLDEQKAREVKLKEERKEELFSGASKVLSVNKDELINAVGKNASYEIGDIAFSNKLIKELQSKERKICTIPNTFLERISEKITSKKLISSLEFDIKKIDDINVLVIRKKEKEIRKKDKFFDKIASGKRAIMETVINSSISKSNLLRSWIGIDKELLSKVKKALITMNDSYKERKSERYRQNLTGNEISNEVETISSNIAMPNNKMKDYVDNLNDNNGKLNTEIISMQNNITKKSDSVKTPVPGQISDKFSKLLDEAFTETQRPVTFAAYDIADKKENDTMEDIYSDSSKDPSNKQKKTNFDQEHSYNSKVEEYMSRKSVFSPNNMTDEEFDALLARSNGEISEAAHKKR